MHHQVGLESQKILMSGPDSLRPPSFQDLEFALSALLILQLYTRPAGFLRTLNVTTYSNSSLLKQRHKLSRSYLYGRGNYSGVLVVLGFFYIFTLRMGKRKTRT
jgi:hypothetical protein